MKPFRLQTVERLRGQALDERARQLHAVSAERDAVRAERNRLTTLLSGGVGLTTSQLWSGAALDLANNYRLALRQQIDDQDERIAELEERIDAARSVWLQARGDLHAVQALHESHRRAVAAERARAEQRELDERAATRRPGGRPAARPAGADGDERVGVR